MYKSLMKRPREDTLEDQQLPSSSKKLKEGSILSLVIDKNLEALKELVNNGADISITGNLQLGNQTLEEVTPLFAATTSGHE